jgi:hypothetical protein
MAGPYGRQIQIAHQAQLDDVEADLRVDDLAQPVANVVGQRLVLRFGLPDRGIGRGFSHQQFSQG